MNDNQDKSAGSLTFSQREGYESLPEPMRLEELSDDLRREIWNKVRELLRSSSFVGLRGFGSAGEKCIERVLGKLLRMNEDEISTDYEHIMQLLKNYIMQEDRFNKVLDLIEIIVDDESVTDEFANKIAYLFEVHAAAYWLDTSRRPYQFFPCSTKEQGEATRAAIETIRASSMEGAETHLRQAVDHINAGQYADSITDSIHAVESVARIICPEAKTLSKALDALQRDGLLKHPALKEAFSKLYGYTSDEQGLRHSLLDKNSADVGLDEAVFMFGACASFAAYLASKNQRMKQGDNES